MSINTRLGLVFIATVIVRLAFYFITHYTADDAFITFRYADNIAHGLGYVYNEGQHVQGTTTPLFTFVMALFTLMRVPPITAALFISLVASGATSVIIYRFAQSLRFTRWTLLPVVAYILWPRSLPADTSGMETAVFTLLVTAALYFRHRKLDYYAIGMATLATVTRPEGAMVLGLVFLSQVYEHRDRWASYVTIPAMILGPWLLFAYFYFGSIVPNSIHAKLALYSQWGTMSTWDTLVYLMAWHNSFGMVVTVAVLIGGYWLIKKQNFGRIEIFWMVAMVAFYTFGDSRVFFWYITPIYPIYLIFGCAAVEFSAEKVNLSPASEDRWRNIIVVAAAIVLAFGCYKPAAYYRDFQHAQINMHRAVGLFLSRESVPGELVAAEDIGYMGYYSKRTILDRDGIVSPEVIRYNAAGNYFGPIEEFEPEWVVAAPSSPTSDFLSDTLFHSRYFLVGSYRHKELEYRVYREGSMEDWIPHGPQIRLE